jgi:hypothetical protein
MTKGEDGRRSKPPVTAKEKIPMDLNRNASELTPVEWAFLVGPERKSHRATFWIVAALLATFALAVLLAVI